MGFHKELAQFFAGKCSIQNAFLRIDHPARDIGLVHITQSIAGRTGSILMIEGEMGRMQSLDPGLRVNYRPDVKTARAACR